MASITESIQKTDSTVKTTPEILGAINNAQMAKEKGDYTGQKQALQEFMLGIQTADAKRQIQAARDLAKKENDYYDVSQKLAESLNINKKVEMWIKAREEKNTYLQETLGSIIFKDHPEIYKILYGPDMQYSRALLGIINNPKSTKQAKADANALMASEKVGENLIGKPWHSASRGTYDDETYRNALKVQDGLLPKAVAPDPAKETTQESQLRVLQENQTELVKVIGQKAYDDLYAMKAGGGEADALQWSFWMNHITKAQYDDALAVMQKREAAPTASDAIPGLATIDANEQGIKDMAKRRGWPETFFDDFRTEFVLQQGKINAWDYARTQGLLTDEDVKRGYLVDLGLIAEAGGVGQRGQIDEGNYDKLRNNFGYDIANVSGFIMQSFKGGSEQERPVLRRGFVRQIIDSIKTEGGKFDEQGVLQNAQIIGPDTKDLITDQIMRGDPTRTYRTDYNNAKLALAANADIRNSIQELDSLGIETSLTRGGTEWVAQLAGKTTDPRVAELRADITRALQTYRRAMTGLAATSAEMTEILSIAAGIKKGKELNLANLKSEQKQAIRIMQGSVEAVAGANWRQFYFYKFRQKIDWHDFKLLVINIQTALGENETEEQIRDRAQSTGYNRNGIQYSYDMDQFNKALELAKGTPKEKP